MSETRGVFKTGVSAVIYSNTSKLIKGNTVRDKFLVMADSVLFKDSDANVADGYLGIHPTDVNVDISFIKSISPSGKFLKDNGTWDTLTSSTFSSTFIFASGYGIDTTDTEDDDILNIGVTNANIINYGNSSTQHNFFGTAIYEQQVNSFVTDKLITLNNGGAAASGIGVGFEIIEEGVVTGYFKTNGSRNGYSLKSPSSEFYVDINTDDLTGDRSFSFPDTSGAFLIGYAGDGMIAYGVSGALTGSSNFLWNGSVFKVNGSSFLGGTTDPTAWLHLAAGSTSKAPLRLTSGALRTSTEIGAFEFLTDRLYFTKTTGSTRETIAFLSDISSSTPGGSDYCIQYNYGSTFEGSTNFLWEDDDHYFKVDGASIFGLATTNNPTAFVDIARATTGRASLRIRPTSGGVSPSSPNNGDIWQDGEFIYINLDAGTFRFMLEPA